MIGWTALLLGLVLAAALDPWAWHGSTSPAWGDGIAPGLRHVQGVVFGMAFLQLGMSHLLATRSFDHRVGFTAGLTTGAGAICYAGGYALGLLWPDFHTLALAGSLLNLGGLICLLHGGARGAYADVIRMILPVACFGMLLDSVAALLQVLPADWVAESFGAGDGIRLRLLRLARVAAIALSVLTLLYYGLSGRGGPKRAGSWGGICLAMGAVGMPLMLAMACFTTVDAKYLLPLPATAVMIGVCVAFTRALSEGGLLEWFGWGLIALSISAGMLIGLYAFEGPFPAPSFMGAYSETPRELTRIAHAYGVVLGMASIFVSRALSASNNQRCLTNVQ